MTVRYTDGGGLTPVARQRREAVRMQAAALLAQETEPPEVAAVEGEPEVGLPVAPGMAERTARGPALEELKGIRQRVRLRKPQRVALHSWVFAQLGDFVVYKAKRAGVPLVFVDPAYTSQTCVECGHVDKRNRVDQGLFICRGCGVVAHADRNASRDIARRGEVVWNVGRESRVPAAP